jgi:hypothetical protein
MSSIEAERSVAADAASSQADWSEKHAAVVRRRIAEIAEAWTSDDPYLAERLPDDVRGLWSGLGDDAWRQRAALEMDTIYTSVRKKGRYGGVLRRQLYRRRFTDQESFRLSVESLHSITEPLMQSALACKSGQGAFSFPVEKFFESPLSYKSYLGNIDPKKDQAGNPTGSRYDEDALCKALGESTEPTGLLAWFAKPTFQTLLEQLRLDPVKVSEESGVDPRISWYLK